MKITLDRLFQQKFALLRVISNLSCQYVQYILQSKFKDICLSQTQMKTQSNQMMMSKYLKVKLIMMIEVLEMIQTRQVTVKLKSFFPSTQNIQPQHLNHCLFISECEEIQGQESPSSAGHRRETAVSTSKRNSKTALYEFLNETAGQSFSVEKEARPSIKMEMNCFVQTGVRSKRQNALVHRCCNKNSKTIIY